MTLFLSGLLSIIGCSNPVSDDPENGNNQAFTDKDVVISEFMVVQENTLSDPDFGEFGGWIELHNREDEEVDLGGWILAGDDPALQPDMADVLPEGTTIGPDSYLLIWTNGLGETGEAIHLGFSLSEAGGTIGLFGPEKAEAPVIDTVSYTAMDVVPDISWGRMNFDGSDHKGFLLPMNNPTPGEANRLARLQKRNSFELNIGDPSGLDVDHTGNYLWTVSDNPGGSIYKITREGEIVKELEVGGEDMEGISQHPTNHNHLLYVVEERQRKIVQYDTDGNLIQSDSVAVEITNENDGLEGIAINPVNNHVFVVNKRLPRALIELDLRAAEQQVRYTPINFGAEDDAPGLSLAGLFFDQEDEVLWLVSDEARAVFVLDLTGRPLAAFDAREKDLESIALIREENRIYMTSDGDHTLYEFEYPQPLLKLPVSP